MAPAGATTDGAHPVTAADAAAPRPADATASIDATAGETGDAPAFTAMDRLALGSEPANDGGGMRLKLAWAASILILIGAGGAGYVWRDALMQAWPPSHRLYAALGLSPAAATPDPGPGRR